MSDPTLTEEELAAGIEVDAPPSAEETAAGVQIDGQAPRSRNAVPTMTGEFPLGNKQSDHAGFDPITGEVGAPISELERQRRLETGGRGYGRVAVVSPQEITGSVSGRELPDDPINTDGSRNIGLYSTRETEQRAQVAEGGAGFERLSDRAPDVMPDWSPISAEQARAAALGIGQGATFGHMDEVAGAVHSATGGGYAEGRDRAREVETRAEAEAPGAYLAGQLGGVAATIPFMPNVAGRLAGSGAGVATRVGAAATEGALYGALGGEGYSEADTAEGVLRDTARGAGLGLATGGALAGASEGARAGVRRLANSETGQRAVSGLRRLANGSRFRALMGGTAHPPTGMARDMVGTARGRQERLETFLADAERFGINSMDDAERAMGQAGDDLGRVAQELDNVATGGTGYRTGFEDSLIRGEHVAQRMNALADDIVREGGDEMAANALRSEADRWAQRGEMDFSTAWNYRQRLNDPKFWRVGSTGDMAANQDHMRRLYGLVSEELETAALRGDPTGQLAHVWRENLRKYSIASPLFRAGAATELRGMLNTPGGLIGSTLAGAGAFTAANSEDGSIGGAMGAAGLALLANGARQRIHRPRARMYDAIRSVLERGGAAQAPNLHRAGNAAQGLGEAANPTGFDQLRRAAQMNPDALGLYGHTFSNAAQRGPGAFAATYYTLWHRDPEFRQQMQALDSAEDERRPDQAAGSAQPMGETTPDMEQSQ